MTDLDTLLAELMALRPARYSVDLALLTVTRNGDTHSTWAACPYSPNATSAQHLAVSQRARELGVSVDAALAWSRGDDEGGEHWHLRGWTVWTEEEGVPPLTNTRALGALMDALAHCDPAQYRLTCHLHHDAPTEWREWLAAAKLVRLA